MDHEKALSELEAWLEAEARSYDSGELMGLSGAIVGRKVINDVLAKFAKLKAATRC